MEQNIWEYRIKEAFKNTGRKHDSVDLLWSIIALFLFSSSKDRILTDIYNFFDDKSQFVQLISLLDGRTFKAPTKKAIEEALLTAVFYLEKELHGKSWKEIQDGLDFEISPIKYGIKVRNLNTWIKQKLQEIISHHREEENNE